MNNYWKDRFDPNKPMATRAQRVIHYIYLFVLLLILLIVGGKVMITIGVTLFDPNLDGIIESIIGGGIVGLGIYLIVRDLKRTVRSRRS